MLTVLRVERGLGAMKLQVSNPDKRLQKMRFPRRPPCGRAG